MMTREEAPRQRADKFANLATAFMATARRYPGATHPRQKADEVYSAAEDIREQLDGQTRKEP